MAKDFAKSFYNSVEWQRCRENVLRRNNYLCEECLKQGKITAADTVHHIKHITVNNINDPDITLNEDNLMAVCRDCHARLHQKSRDTRYKFDSLGRIII